MKPFRIYRNLHKGNFSIQSYIEDKRGYRVTDRASTVILVDCTFRIYEAGRQKVIKEKRKNVHAYVEAISYRHIKGDVDVSSLREIYYNPYNLDSFVYKDTGERVVKKVSILTYDNKLYDVTNKLI
jgi:hypothetical protein